MIKSLLHFNNPNDLTKDEGKELTWQVDGATADTNGKFGSAIDLTSGKRLVADKKWDIIQTGDFTIDFWVNVHSNTSSGRFISSRPSYSVSDAIEFYVRATGHIILQLGFTGSDFLQNLGDIPISLSTWHHLAVVRKNDDFIFFVDGRTVWNGTHSGSLYVSSSNKNITLGGYYSQANVSLDEFRISNTALWTSDFTPSAYEYGLAKFIYIDKNNTVMGMKE